MTVVCLYRVQSIYILLLNSFVLLFKSNKTCFIIFSFVMFCTKNFYNYFHISLEKQVIKSLEKLNTTLYIIFYLISLTKLIIVVERFLSLTKIYNLVK